MGRFSPQKTKIYRRRLLDKGAEVAKRLADLMAGKDIHLPEMANVRLPGGRTHRTEDRLRAYLNLIVERRQALEADDGSFGLCEECGEELSEAELDEMPWATRCRSCASGV